GFQFCHCNWIAIQRPGDRQAPVEARQRRQRRDKCWKSLSRRDRADAQQLERLAGPVRPLGWLSPRLGDCDFPLWNSEFVDQQPLREWARDENGLCECERVPLQPNELACPLL